MAQFAGSAHWAELSPLFAHRARPTPLNCKNEYLVLALGEETAAQAVVGSIVWAFRRLKKPISREMSARRYALHSVRPQLSFFSYCKMKCVAGGVHSAVGQVDLYFMSFQGEYVNMYALMSMERYFE